MLTLHFGKSPTFFQQHLSLFSLSRHSPYLVIKIQSKSYKKFTLARSKGTGCLLSMAVCRQKPEARWSPFRAFPWQRLVIPNLSYTLRTLCLICLIFFFFRFIWGDKIEPCNLNRKRKGKPMKKKRKMLSFLDCAGDRIL